MKNRTSLLLLELLIMILFFSLTAALCLQAFFWSDRVSREEVLKSRALQTAVNASEVVKYCSGDFEEAVKISGGRLQEGSWILDEADFSVEAVCTETGIDGLGGAEVCAYGTDGELLAELPVRWQKPLTGEEDAAEYGSEDGGGVSP